MITLEICAFCQGEGSHRVVSRETVLYKFLEFTWTFPFVRSVTREFEEVFCVDEHRKCDECDGEGEIPILEFSNEELKRKIH